jgi:hypothetical protein
MPASAVVEGAPAPPLADDTLELRGWEPEEAYWGVPRALSADVRAWAAASNPDAKKAVAGKADAKPKADAVATPTSEWDVWV